MAEGATLVSLIPIKKMNRAIKFYTKCLGATVEDRGEGEMKDYWASLQLGGSTVWFVAPEKREKRKLAYHNFVVKDIRKFVASLQRNDVEFEKPVRMSKRTKVEGPIAFDKMGGSAFFYDSEGNLLMAWQRPA